MADDLLPPRRIPIGKTVPQRAIPDDMAHLKPVSGRPSFREYLVQLGERRHFIFTQAWSQSTHQHRGMVLGNLWLILAPILDGAVYFFIFGVLFHSAQSRPWFLGYLVIGIFMFGITGQAMSQGANVINANKGLLRAFSFPKAAVVVSLIVRQAVGAVPVILALTLILMTVPPHYLPKTVWILFPLVFALQMLFNFGLACIMARIGATLPDVRQLVPYLVRLIMYSSCVMFTIDRLASMPTIEAIVRFSPFYQFLSLYRQILQDGTMPDPTLWGLVAAWAVGTAVLGLIFFWRGEVSYGRTR